MQVKEHSEQVYQWSLHVYQCKLAINSPGLHVVTVMWFTMGSCHKRQKPQAPTPQAPIRNRKTRKVASAQVYNR